MWQSKVWKGQQAAFRFYMTALDFSFLSHCPSTMNTVDAYSFACELRLGHLHRVD